MISYLLMFIELRGISLLMIVVLFVARSNRLMPIFSEIAPMLVLLGVLLLYPMLFRMFLVCLG